MKMHDFISKRAYFKEKYYQKDVEYIRDMEQLKLKYYYQDLKGKIIKYFGLEKLCGKKDK